jgi:hypothetical protein
VEKADCHGPLWPTTYEIGYLNAIFQQTDDANKPAAQRILLEIDLDLNGTACHLRVGEGIAGRSFYPGMLDGIYPLRYSYIGCV